MCQFCSGYNLNSVLVFERTALQAVGLKKWKQQGICTYLEQKTISRTVSPVQLLSPFENVLVQINLSAQHLNSRIFKVLLSLNKAASHPIAKRHQKTVLSSATTMLIGRFPLHLSAFYITTSKWNLVELDTLLPLQHYIKIVCWNS